MITIYCLIDGRDDKPFYVGATQSLLKTRLDSHVCHSNFYRSFTKNSIGIQKAKMINAILDSGHKVIIRPLELVNEFSVNHYEEFYYTLFIKQGFTLLQSKSHFKYKEQSKYFKPVINENQQLTKYLDILRKF